MRFLIDEDVDRAVADFLAADHGVHHATAVFGIQTKDPNNVAWAKANHAVLVTGDRQLANSLRLKRTCACLHLHDLVTEELRRVTELLAVIEAEYSILGERFWMRIGSELYTVGR